MQIPNIFNQIDKIYIEKTGMPYSVSAASGNSDTCFYVKTVSGNAGTITVKKTGNPTGGSDLSYSTDGKNWTLCTYDSEGKCNITASKVYFRSSTGLSSAPTTDPVQPQYKYNNFYNISANVYHSVGGDIRTLLDYTNPNLDTAPEYCFFSLFMAPNDRKLFLSDAGKLDMSKLVNVSESCYDSMFDGNTTLKNVPARLPAMTLAKSCYHGMFSGCSSLSVIPVLPATTLAEECYSFMFKGVGGLLREITLPATTLAPYCYAQMFYQCNQLTRINLYATEITENSLNGWLSGAKANGTLYNYGCADIPSGNSGLPDTWTEVKDCQEPPKFTLNKVLIDGPYSCGPFSNVYNCHYDITFNETPPTPDEYGGYNGYCYIDGVCVADTTGVIKDTGDYQINGIVTEVDYPEEYQYCSGDPTYPYGGVYGPATLTILDENGNIWDTSTTQNVIIERH